MADAQSQEGVARSVLVANRIPFLDLTDCVRRVPAANRFVIGHYSPATNHAVAACVRPVVQQLMHASE